jgi:single-strand DNA-binding protein
MSNPAPTSRATLPTTSHERSLNLTVLRGELLHDPSPRALASGEVVVQFDLRVEAGDGGSRISVPVSWSDPPAIALRGVSGGSEVVVLGWTRRRFFRAGGVTQSRTEVVAARVVRARRARAVESLVADAIATLQGD